MLEAAVEALAIILEPHRLLMMVVGVGTGLVIGVLPGMGGAVGMSVLLPFIFGMDPYSAMALLIGMVAVTATSDTIPAVLMGVPGSSAAAATIMDGYPLARQGQAARAFGAAFTSSMLGGLIGALSLFLVIPLARPLILAFGSPELLMLCVLGLTMVATVSANNPTQGVIAALLGLLLGAVGGAPTSPEYRYTFDWLYLFDGIPLAVLALGLFALPEMVDLLRSKGSISMVHSSAKGAIEGVRDVFRNFWLVVRSSMVGVFIGALPGLGGNAASWITYGQAVQFAKDKGRFGKGDIRGVIAPESANNACEGGTLIPTLLFGVPGSGTTAILLSGFVLLGLQPGPRMATDHLDLVLSICWSLALANVLGTASMFMFSRPIAMLAQVPAPKLVPFIMVFMMVAAYQNTRDWGDLIVFGLIGLLGWVMKQLDWPRAAMLIGLVLSDSTERYLWLSIDLYGWSWLLRPGVIVIGLISILSIVAARGLRRRLMAERTQAPAEDAGTAVATGAGLS